MKKLLTLFLITPFICLGQVLEDCENISQPLDFVQCDVNNDSTGLFNLSFHIPSILGGQDPSNYNISFHVSQADALNNTNPVATDGIYTNTSNPQEIYTRITDTNNTCLSITSFSIEVRPSPTLVDSTILVVCDDEILDEITPTDLTVMDEEIRGGNSNYSISYYLTQMDAVSAVNPLSMPYTNLMNPQTFFVRGEDTITGCFTTTTLDLEVTDCTVSSPVCGDTIFDSGGATGSYGNNDLTTVTVYPDDAGGLVTFTFLSFGTESCCDDLTVYDGPDINADVVGVYAGSTIPDPISSSHPTGALTFVFDSDASVTDIGYEILVSCSPAPSCLQVSDLEVSTITGDSADISWTANNGETAWEYVIQPQGTGDPTTAGTPITTNPYTITGLDSSTDYEIFVRAICSGTDSSPWRGPVNFTTSYLCGDTIFDSGGATGNYGNNELTTVTIFPENTGDLVTFTFISFDTENNYDFLTVYDGPDVSSTEIGSFSGSTIPDPITSSHPTGALTFVFDSDGSVNNPGYEILVSCAVSTVGIIQVNAFVDANLNTVYDNDEFSFSSGYFTYELNGDGIINNVSSSTGNFQIISENETDFYNISFNLYDEYVDCYDITQFSFDNISVATGSTISIEFPVIEEQSCNDLAVYLINYSIPPRPGFSHYNYLVLQNLGFTPISSGTVEYTHDPLLIYNSVTSVNPNYTITTTATGFTVDFVNLLPGSVEYIEVSLTSPVNLELGDIVTNTATYSTNTNDIESSNNFSTLSELVVGSWDPNDKMESRGPSILYDDFVNSDNWLYYTVRFQNLGTFPATFVRIEDELDSQLDETSFQMLQSSHDYVVKRTLSSLEWFFDDINLPAEQDDSQGSNGFIYFRIKPNTGYAVGDVIPNTAEIYFDFNEPVITNRFETEFIQDTFSVSEFDNRGFNMYPNPTNDILNIKLNNINKANLSIWDIRGKLISQQTIFEEQNLDLNVLELQSGIYFVKINTPHTKIVKKLIIK